MEPKKYLVTVVGLDDIDNSNLHIDIFKKQEKAYELDKKVSVSGFHVPYLSFIEENKTPFTLKTENTQKNWDGALYYSTDANNWSEWNGEEINSSELGRLYLRGLKNSTISGQGEGFRLTDNKRIRCVGNIENLLDFKDVELGKHPVMASYCFSYMFFLCKSLVTPPELPATTLANGCYYDMFSSCWNLKEAPDLPAMELTDYCYKEMFKSCTSLTRAPYLPATKLAKNCYTRMFEYCASLKDVPPELPATMLADYCYNRMFADCTSITGAPKLPAMELSEGCYEQMFDECTALLEAPDLPATKLVEYCYCDMFLKCKSLVKAPDLPATELAMGCYGELFRDCESLTGQIHCAKSVSEDKFRLADYAIKGTNATIVFDL